MIGVLVDTVDTMIAQSAAQAEAAAPRASTEALGQARDLSLAQNVDPLSAATQRWEAELRAGVAAHGLDADVFVSALEDPGALVEVAARRRRLTVRLDHAGEVASWAVTTPDRVEFGPEETFTLDRALGIFAA